MKKIGIITFHRALNYGAVLQAYAMKAVCDANGFDTQIVDYRFNGTKDDIAPVSQFLKASNKKKAIGKLAIELISYFGNKKREKEFISFRKNYLCESSICKTSDDIKNLKYDILVSGSDQIWNYKITGGEFDRVFFLDINAAPKNIIYAASSQDVPFPLDMEMKLKRLIDNSKAHISIREEKLANYVGEITGKNYPVVLDPTLLAGKEIMSGIPTIKRQKKKYILVYQIDSNHLSDVSVKNLKKYFNYDVYTMSVPRIGNIKGRKGNCGPEKFLSLLKGAEFLVTNSFHGIALSLIFEKQFYVYENGGVMSRIDNLLGQVGLIDRKINMVKDIDLDQNIDYKIVNSVLDKLRNESMAFLKAAFKDEVTYKTPQILALEDLHKDIGTRKKNECCGCSGCVDVCPVNAIEMKRDCEGFLYPSIDKSKCIHCGKCNRACGFNKRQRTNELPKAFGVKHKNLHIRESSRSGAAFVAFSDVILNNNGAVYGAAMQKDFSVKHIRATTYSERDLMKKAKYVQSDTINVFLSVKNDLQNGTPVLFSGTPCQVSSLKRYLFESHVPMDELVCCDMICHGVPSPMVWKDYVKHIEHKFDDKITEANFRDKDFGWDSHCETFVLKKHKNKIVANEYTDLFYQHLMFRPSCYNCQFTNVYRPGDLTLADFWGIEKHDKRFNDNRGVSLVLVNTPKGERIFDKALESFEWFQCKIENCMQPTLYTPSKPSLRKDDFWADYSKMSFEKLIKKYTTPKSVQGRIKKFLKLFLYKVGIRQYP